MTRTRIHALVLIVMLVSAVPTRAGADDDSRTKKAKLAAELDVLKANDLELESAVKALDAGIAVQASDTEAARQAATAADAAVDTAKVRLAATEKRAAELRQKASVLAINAYIHPGGVPILDMVKSSSLAEASRRQTLMAHVVNVDRDVLGQLKAVRQDQQAEQANLIALRNEAQERKKAASVKLADLEKTRADQVRLRGALDVRIREYTAEIDALSREEANITRLIREREAAGRSADGVPVGPAPRGASGGGLAWPADGGVSSPFGFRWGRLHAGIDIDSGYGAPIRAAKAGVVIMAGYNGGYGNCIIVDHGGGLTTLYAHQSRMVASDGQSVSRGEVIGYVGGTGNVTGPHLHFETRVGGAPQNPLNFLP
ncbi:MAG: peptidoglycan DD-metalloendopeptidase family protein [Actinomycetota bacterium]|nr:peptidoglycan DD-metalloendopeptidase family protein [Actinomycetota bacterium]